MEIPYRTAEYCIPTALLHDADGKKVLGSLSVIIMALIALSAELTAAKVCDIKRRGGMLGVVTACRCCKWFPFSFHI